MAREIKFRAWLSGQDRYVGVDAIDFDEDSIRINDEYFFLADLEQYTGLTDKNGVEIYEGDVVIASILTPQSYDNPDDNIHKIGGAVVFEDGSYKFDNYLLFDDSIFDLKIIGNIHENPELI